jgi:pyridoxamine-phosphate oxidase
MKPDKKIHNIRRDYRKHRIIKSELSPDPYIQFCRWFEEILCLQISDPTAFILSTVSIEGKPASRVVLLKGHSPKGFVFFTNYSSNKGQQIELNPDVSMLFFWPEAERQIRIEGRANRVSKKDSDEYFQSRPRESKIAAIISKQSQPVEPDTDLQELFTYAMESMCHDDLVRPDYWGGFQILPEKYEFWQGRAGRMHNRYVYIKSGLHAWEIIQLQP